MSKSKARPKGADATGLTDDPVIVGADNIAIIIYGETEGRKAGSIRRIYHAISKKEIPTFSLGGRVHARRSKILAWIENQERAG